MKVKFAILVHVMYQGKSLDWLYSTSDSHPNDLDIEEALKFYKGRTYGTDEVPTICHARVEKRYMLQ